MLLYVNFELDDIQAQWWSEIHSRWMEGRATRMQVTSPHVPTFRSEAARAGHGRERRGSFLLSHPSGRDGLPARPALTNGPTNTVSLAASTSVCAAADKRTRLGRYRATENVMMVIKIASYESRVCTHILTSEFNVTRVS